MFVFTRKKMEKFLFSLCIFISFINLSVGLNCYQCSGSDPTVPFQCNEALNMNDIDIKPEPCTHVHDAKFCIKHYGRYEASAIKCYQCSAAQTIDCSDGMIHYEDTTLKPQNCSHVYGAQYCIKSNVLDGGIGVHRYCSSLDLGNYCNDVQQPGDILTYRTCIYTCTGDGCNAGYIPIIPIYLLICSLLFSIVLIR